MGGKLQVCTADGCTSRPVGRRLCRKHYQQAWKAGELGAHEKLPRVIDRKICPPEHRHGASGTCYVHHQCRCEDCSTSQTKRNYRRLQLKAYGRYDNGLVDVEPVREHMLMLAEFGMGYKHVARLAGIGITPVRNVIWGRQDPGPRYGEMQKRIKRETAEKILAVKPDVSLLAGGAKIPARGTHRRLQALVSMGWSQSKLAERLGMDPTNMTTLMQRNHVLVSTHRAVAALFDELWDVTPTAATSGERRGITMAKRYAKKRRWLSPLAWDDIDTDEEPPVPDEVVGVDEALVHLAVSGDHVRLSPEERRVAVRVLHEARLSDGAIAERLHVTGRTVLRIRQELGLSAAVGADGQPMVA